MPHREIACIFVLNGQGAKSGCIGQKGKITNPVSNKKAESKEKGETQPLSLIAISGRTSRFEIKIVQQGAMGRNKYYHTENVENRYINMNRFLERFHGVSSSYLQNYLYWYMVVDLIMYKIDSSAAMVERSMAVPKGKEIFKNCKMFA